MQEEPLKRIPALYVASCKLLIYLTLTVDFAQGAGWAM
jgi:hypothetical protein